MTFPRRTDVARHLARKPRLVSKMRPAVIADQVADTDLQLPGQLLLGSGGGAQNSDSSAFVTESAAVKLALGPDILPMALGSAHNEDRLVGV